MTRLAAIAVALILAVPAAQGATKKVKAKGEAPYGFGASKKVRRTAVADAKKRALRKYVAEIENSSRRSLLEMSQGKMEADIENYITAVEIIDEGKNKETKKYEVIIEASIEEALVERLVKNTAAATAKPDGGGEAPYITFLFVARQEASVKAFDAKRTSVSRATTTTDDEETTAVTGNTVTASSAGEKTAMVQTGGSTEQKADTVQYQVSTVTDVDAALNEIFSKAGYECVDPRDAELDVDSFRDEYSVGDDISRPTRKGAITKCREMEIAFFATGHMDIGVPGKDAATGMTRVYVKVSAKVTDLRKRLPRTLASIRGVQYAGLGPNAQVAKQNALNTAATRSAVDLVDQLRAKGVRVAQ